MKAVAELKNKNHPQLIPDFRKPERKLLSVFMSLLEAVPSFRGVFLKNIGYNSGETSTYVSFMEPQFDNNKAPNNSRPDGLFACMRGKTQWSAFLEAKAGRNNIDQDQIQKYIDLASFYKVDSVISISNEHALTPSELPYTLNKTRRKNRQVFHLSWSHIQSEIGLFLENTDRCSEAELRILREVHRYFSGKESGVQTFDQMPEAWKDFVKSAQAPLGFNTKTAGVNRLTYAWQQERRDMCVKLSALAGYSVSLYFPPKLRKDEKGRFRADLARLTQDYELEAHYLFGNTKVFFSIVVEMRNTTCNYTFCLQTPSGKKAKASVNWLAGILSDYRGEPLQVNIDWPGRASDYCGLREDFLRDPSVAYEGQTAPPKQVMLIIRQQQRAATFGSRKKFIETLESTALNFSDFMRQAGFI